MSSTVHRDDVHPSLLPEPARRAELRDLLQVAYPSAHRGSSLAQAGIDDGAAGVGGAASPHAQEDPRDVLHRRVAAARSLKPKHAIKQIAGCSPIWLMTLTSIRRRVPFVIGTRTTSWWPWTGPTSMPDKQATIMLALITDHGAQRLWLGTNRSGRRGRRVVLPTVTATCSSSGTGLSGSGSRRAASASQAVPITRSIAPLLRHRCAGPRSY